MSSYRRASKKQIAYAESLAAETGTQLPWETPGMSNDKIVKLIHRLEKLRDKAVQVAEAEPDKQVGMF